MQFFLQASQVLTVTMVTDCIKWLYTCYHYQECMLTYSNLYSLAKVKGLYSDKKQWLCSLRIVVHYFPNNAIVKQLKNGCILYTHHWFNLLI